MRLKVHHETRYVYETPPVALVQRLHLEPAVFSGQQLISWGIIAPGIENALRYQDAFGNVIHLVTSHDEAREVAIITSGEVETVDCAGVVRGIANLAPESVFLRATPATFPNPELRAFASGMPSPRSVIEQAHSLMQAVRANVAYELGTSHAHTTAAEAFAERRGVCQDQAHILITLARAVGIPARYVTGYLVTGQGASSAAAHAWAELWIPDLGWVGFDAANGQCPTDHYVRVAAGLDAAHVAPVRGSRRGGGGPEHLHVEVRVEIAQQ